MSRDGQSGTKRDVALDVTRGICVFAMAVHHCINYFPGYPLFYWRFVTGAFPFLAGYLTTGILRERYTGVRVEGLIGLKLLIRGGKLLLICLGMNLAIRAVLPEMTKLETKSLFEAVKVVLFTGDYKTVSFSLLIPIGYVICFSGVLRMLYSRRSVVLIPLTCSLFVYCSFRHFTTESGYYLCYFAIGMLGMLWGFADRSKVAEWAQRRIVSVGFWVLSIILISILGQPFPIYALYVVASVVIFYSASKWMGKYEQISSVVALHGQYSLLMYLGPAQK